MVLHLKGHSREHTPDLYLFSRSFNRVLLLLIPCLSGTTTSALVNQHCLVHALNGAFRKALVEVHTGVADYTGDGIITLNMLDLYLSERVKKLTEVNKLQPQQNLKRFRSSPMP